MRNGISNGSRTSNGNGNGHVHDDPASWAPALEIANVPTLLMVLVQLTGERKWLEPPYRPQRARGMGDNDTGGLAEDVQREIRDAALEAITAWRAGRPMAIPEPSPELLVEMLGCAMGETVPPEYGPMIAAQLQVQGLEDVVPAEQQPTHVPDGFEVLVIGAGASGLCAAFNLQRNGIPFRIIEKNATVGGTWWENRYPGAGVDTPNHLYSFSFASYDWTKYFVLRDELHDYLEHVADQLDVRPNIAFQTEVEAAVYDEPAQRWSVTVRHADGSREVLRPNVVISGVGIFNPLKYPDIPGLDSFRGPLFHTAQWPDDLDLTGKRVAIIGNGASAMQTGPAVQGQVASLTIFQRSTQWAAPFEQFGRLVPDPLRALLRDVPLYRGWYRVRLGWTFNDRVFPALHKDPDWEHPERSLNATNDAHREYFTQYILSELGERTDLVDKVVPTYPPFGKRMLMDNGWFRMLTKDNVELVTDRIGEITPTGVRLEDGTAYEFDVIVIATGFDVLRFITSYETRGRSGRTLREVWDDDDARAYLGLTIPDFPNFFTLYGPNTQAGHGGSLIFIVEMQMHYVMDVLRQMLDNDIGAVECRQDVHDVYNEGIDEAHEHMVWTHPGMQTYYRNDRGRIVVNLPYRNVDMFANTRHANLDEYVVEPRRETAGQPA
ncbi:MAG: monooxygenase [Ilumatobacteraceae bacterium]|nr:monooxygenase [Ilumatobacteraceae bacterium]